MFRGSFAIVKEGWHKASGISVAIKVLDKTALRRNNQVEDNEVRESVHPNVIPTILYNLTHCYKLGQNSAD